MKIELVEYSSDWPQLFDEEKKLITTNFPVLNIVVEHIGSTAVSKLKAKPIIDIMVGVPTIPEDLGAVVNHFQILNYQYIEKYNLIMPERRYFIKEKNGNPTHHVHMVATNSDFWQRHLFFRNQLRDNYEIREKYQNLKIDLAQQEWNSSNDYAVAKNDFIKAVDSLRLKG
jgi:GrpB-like predicted nucleotidyltransferase (UPF0157 family)